jgi:hypothetical protein
MSNRVLTKKQSAPVAQVDELYNLENYEDAELYEILGLSADFTGDDPALSNAILKQIQKFSNIEPGQENNSSEAKKMAKFFLNIYDYFFPDETVADGIQNAYDDGDPETIFDIASNYTDAELYELLGLDNPSDQLLEAKLTLLISQYSKFKNDNNQPEQKQLYMLYKQIYAYFFAGTDESIDPPVKNPPKNEWAQNETRSMEDLNNEIKLLREKNKALSSQLATTPLNTTAQPSKSSESVIGYTQPLAYSKGALNPILKQTITRIISIDSQYRSDKTKIPTEFTFNLSEPLRDVVSLRLYSVQIPYTWYTIGTAYGNNFFYFKGRTSGIEDGDHDVKVEIPPGNYTPSTLVGRINESIQAVATNLFDTAIGTTAVAYNQNNSMCTITSDLAKSYNESSFSLSFSGWTSPYLADASRNNSIPAYLGFQTSTYLSNILRSAPIFERIELNTQNNTLFYLASDYNYATIVLYSGDKPYTHGTSTVDLSFNVSMSLTTDASHNRLAIVSDLNTQIQSSPYLNKDNSYIRRTNIDPLNTNTSTSSYFEMKITPDRFTMPITQNTQTFVVFPDASNSIWTGPNSCFAFDEISVNQINQIVSDQPAITVSDTYPVSDNPSIELKCSLSGFDGPENDISFSIPESPTGYTLGQYMNVINTSIANFDNLNGGYLNTGGAENKTRAYIENETFKLDLVMNKTFGRAEFKMDLTGSILSNVFNLDQTIDNIRGSYDISLSTTIGSTFISPNGKIATILLTSNTDVSYNITFPSTLVAGSYGVQQIADIINIAFNNYIDSDSGRNLFEGFSFTPFTQTGSTYSTTLNVSIQKVLVPNNYTIQFRSSNDTNSSWETNLKINPSSVASPLSLLSYTAGKITIVADSQLNPSNQIKIVSGVNNTIQFNAIDTGVKSAVNVNNVVVQLDPGSYSRTGLLQEINAKIQATKGNTRTDITGTKFEIVSGRPGSTGQSADYVSITFRAKRAYTSVDYNLVFYDNLSFTTCFTGASSVRNTTWDTTIGWIMGFRKYIAYDLSATFEGESTTIKTTDSAGRILIYGDTGVSTNLYNYFLICLDDYNQNRLNDGLVTITNVDTSIPLPSYASRSEFVCDPITGNRIFNSTNLAQTEAQTYAANVAANSVGTKNSIGSSVSSAAYGTGPFVSDVFGLIPIKTSGLINGAAYVEFGGTLQNQERSYFGPVNIQRMTVRLVNDRGDLVDLNNANWSFSLICEQLNKLTPGAK